jgi:transposase
MREKINQNSFSGQAIYVGIDVHLKEWKVTVMSENIHYKTFTSPPEAAALGKYLFGHFPGATFYAAYEAGFSGFWAHRDLTKLGINAIVVNPADIPTTDKERKQKEDKRDSRKIAKTLQAGQLRGIYVPSEQIQQDRILLRTRDMIVRDITRNKNRIKGRLYFMGIQYPDRFASASSHWSKPFVRWLESIKIEHESGKAGLNVILDMVNHQRMSLLRITRAMNELSKTTFYQENVKLLISIPGIARLTAMKLLTELDNIERFETFDKICSYVGLVPGTNSSGENEVVTGITPRKSSGIRNMLIESAWIAIRNDPALLNSFQTFCKKMKPNRAIIRIAKKLLNRVVRVLRKRERYEKGIVR